MLFERKLRTYNSGLYVVNSTGDSLLKVKAVPVYPKDLKLGDDIAINGTVHMVAYRYLFSENTKMQTIITDDGIERRFPHVELNRIIYI